MLLMEETRCKLIFLHTTPTCYCLVPYGMVWHGAFYILYGMVLYDMAIWYGMVGRKNEWKMCSQAGSLYPTTWYCMSCYVMLCYETNEWKMCRHQRLLYIPPQINAGCH